jgi:cobalamin-independent methionine synthase catalytic subunit
MDLDHPAMVVGRTGRENAVPRVVRPVRRMRPVEVDDLRFPTSRGCRPARRRRASTRSRRSTGRSPASGARPRCAADQLAIETAQPRLDPAILERLPSKTIILGVLDLGDPEAETADQVAARITAALEHVEPERLQVAPDCGMKSVPRELALAKLRALVEGAALVRAQLGVT